MFKYDEISHLIEINKIYLLNINQQLLKPPYQNDKMFNLKIDVNNYIKYLENSLSVHLKACLFFMLYDLDLAES